MADLRRARDDDEAAIREVHREAIRGLAAGHYAPEQIEAWSGPRPPATVPIREKCVFVAEESGRVVGFGEFAPGPDRGEGEVAAIYVRPERAGRGVGAAILARVEEAAREAGVARLWLDSSLNAEGFYARRGFRSLGRGEHLLWNGVAIPCVRMEKRIGSGNAAEVPRTA